MRAFVAVGAVFIRHYVTCIAIPATNWIVSQVREEASDERHCRSAVQF